MNKNKVKRILYSRVIVGLLLLAITIAVFFFVPIYKYVTYINNSITIQTNDLIYSETVFDESYILTKDYFVFIDCIFGKTTDHFSIIASPYSIVISAIAFLFLIVGLINGVRPIKNAEKADNIQSEKIGYIFFGIVAWILFIFFSMIGDLAYMLLFIAPALLITSVRVCAAPFRKRGAFYILIAYIILHFTLASSKFQSGICYGTSTGSSEPGLYMFFLPLFLSLVFILKNPKTNVASLKTQQNPTKVTETA